MTDYQPPFELNEEIIEITTEIAELCGEIKMAASNKKQVVLRRENRIKTIYSSLAIEGNLLSIDHVTAIINGKRVLAPASDIKEVINAYEIYNHLDKLNPYSIDDLLKAHKIMTKDLIKESGVFRSGNAGVYANGQLIHAGTPARYVPKVMKDLFDWLNSSKLHPLIKSCIFHYEFEFIHPFMDGNGRMGRLWHTLLLSKWKSFFAFVPIESLIHDNQQAYYKAIEDATAEGKDNPFVIFMLKMIYQALMEVKETEASTNNNHIDNEKQIISIIKKDPKCSSSKIAEKLDLSTRQVERIIRQLREKDIIEHIGSRRNGYWKVK